MLLQKRMVIGRNNSAGACSKARHPHAARAISTRGMTLTEIICVVVVVSILLGMILPPTTGRRPARRIKCINNLKNVGLAFRIWATDNNDQFPFQVSTNAGGALEFTNNFVFQWQILSNELSTPKILVCPRRYGHITEATNWNLAPGNVSYYLGLRASQTAPAAILSGDTDFLINKAPAKSGINQIRTNDTLAYPKRFHIETDGGNICFADGSVSYLPNADWPTRLAASGSQTNLFVMP
jgi:prepilin-type N-terminal cleavage/methylation domain-containing protein/prepilin-type processing-associated H-X9-DG protein